MTIIAAYEDKDTITIGSDSFATSGDTSFECGSKIITKVDYHIGFCWSLRVADIIREDSAKGLPSYIRTVKDIQQFRDVLKAYMINDGASDKASEEEGTITHPMSLVIISKIGIYTIDSDYAMLKAREGYMANGSGRSIALGALWLAKKMKLDSKAAVRNAVNASIRYTITCGGNCHLKTIEK